MLREIYQNDSVDKIALIIFEDKVFSNSNIREDAVFSESVNAETDFVIGSTCAGQLCFNLLDVNSYTAETDLTGKEFAYQIGANTEVTSVYSVYKQARQDIFLNNGLYWYGGNQKGNYLTVWKDTEGKLEQMDLPEQPIQAVESLFIWEGTLYCGHAAEPYVSAYQINEEGSLGKTSVLLTPLQQFQVRELNRHKKAFRYGENLMYRYEKVRSSGSVTDYLESKYEFTQLGVFIPKSAIKKDDRILSVTAYDRMVYFDGTADYVINNLAYPVTLLDLLKALCAFFGVKLKTSDFLNSDYLVRKNVRTQNVTGRQLLQWIAQAAATFARMSADGELELQWYDDIQYSIDASHGGPTEYSKITVADYHIKKVDKLQIKATENDVGVIVPANDPEKKNAYIIQNNPIFYAETDAELRPTAEKLFNAIKDFQYVPFSVTCKGNPLVRGGDVFPLTSAKGQTIRALVMTKRMSGIKALVDNLSATGNAERAVQSNTINQNIQQLRGSVHELVLSIEEFRSTIKDYQLETDESLRVLSSEIKQVSDEISLRVEKTTYNKDMGIVTQNISSLSLTIEGLKVAVDNHMLTFDINGLSIYNGGFTIYNGNQKIFTVSADGSGLDMVGSILTRGPSQSVRISNGILRFEDSSGTRIGSIMAYDNSLTIMADVINIGTYISNINVGHLKVFASKDGSGYSISKGTVHLNSKETFYPLLWK